eukprot:scaffold2131_cov384-Prasinococcus_capsulatus_cf.AAC.1
MADQLGPGIRSRALDHGRSATVDPPSSSRARPRAQNSPPWRAVPGGQVITYLPTPGDHLSRRATGSGASANAPTGP